MLSPDAMKVMNHKPLGKKLSGGTALYYVWISSKENNSKDAEGVTKRLGLKPLSVVATRVHHHPKRKAEKAVAPILAIVHPSSAVDSSRMLRVVPRVLG